MNPIKRLIYKFSTHRKQCKCCGKTFYKPIYTWVDTIDRDYNDWTEYKDFVSPCCHDYWEEV